MLVASHPAPMYATNCWVLALGPGQECIIADAGMPDISAAIESIVSENHLKPVAALITHGHLDHTYSIKPLADGYSIPAYIHSLDRSALLHPESFHGPEFTSQLSTMDSIEPMDVRELRSNEVVEIVGMKIQAIHAPGHTHGSLMYLVTDEKGDEALISGDVLFAGSIGRTDLPTGSASQMQETLRKKVLPLSDDLRVLTGHGSETTIGIERRKNPYLKDLRS